MFVVNLEMPSTVISTSLLLISLKADVYPFTATGFAAISIFAVSPFTVTRACLLLSNAQSPIEAWSVLAFQRLKVIQYFPSSMPSALELSELELELETNFTTDVPMFEVRLSDTAMAFMITLVLFPVILNVSVYSFEDEFGIVPSVV